MADLIHLDLVTPDRRLIEAEVAELTAVAYEGEVEILPGHANYITLLQCGALSYVEDGEAKHVAVTGGFMEVTLAEGVRIMAEAAEFADEIDVERATSAKDRAERRITDFSKADQEIDVRRAESAMERALIRIQVAGRAK